MNDRQLTRKVDTQVERIKRAARARRTIMAQTTYLGTLGVLFILPVIAGAYLGRWLDEQLAGYSIHWTLSLIILGVAIGAVNVYLFVEE